MHLDPAPGCYGSVGGQHRLCLFPAVTQHALTIILAQADKIATGHNADDIAETVLLNILRGDLPRLSRCAAIITGEVFLIQMLCAE